MSNIVRLSVHRNTRDQRAQYETRRRLKGVVRDALSAIPDASGYALVIWNDKDLHGAFYQRSSDVPTRLIPEYARSSLEHAINDGTEVVG